MKYRRKTWLWIGITAVIIVMIPLVILAKRYYDYRYVLDDCFYTVVPLDYDITPHRDRGGRLTEYTLTGYNADGEAGELSFPVLIDTHKADLYPPGTYMMVSVSKQLVIGRRAVDKNDVPEKAMEKIRTGFAPSAASSPDEYAKERTGQLTAVNTIPLNVSCIADGSVLVYTYVYAEDAKESAEAAAQLLDPVYSVQFRTDKDTIPELTAIILRIELAGGTIVYSQKYDTRVMFDYERDS